MPSPRNRFKAALKTGRPQIGLWLGLADSYAAELSAGAGFDWLLIDAEHAPNDLRSILGQLQAIAPYPASAVVRPPVGEVHRLKQLLDIGAQTILVPMIETADQARAMVTAVRYPPEGVRGVGSGLARASAFGRIPDYLHTAGREVCLLLQVESRRALDNLVEILTVDGVDGIFVGPADLAGRPRSSWQSRSQGSSGNRRRCVNSDCRGRASCRHPYRRGGARQALSRAWRKFCRSRNRR